MPARVRLTLIVALGLLFIAVAGFFAFRGGQETAGSATGFEGSLRPRDLPAQPFTGLEDEDGRPLSLARENVQLTGINGRVQLVEHDLTSGLGAGDFDLVVSNQPYVEPEELPTLQPEVRDWEPHVALGASGATERLAEAATEALRPGGWLVLEVAAGAGERVERLLSELGFENVAITPDLAGRDRVAEGRWTGATST